MIVVHNFRIFFTHETRKCAIERVNDSRKDFCFVIFKTRRRRQPANALIVYFHLQLVDELLNELCRAIAFFLTSFASHHHHLAWHWKNFAIMQCCTLIKSGYKRDRLFSSEAMRIIACSFAVSVCRFTHTTCGITWTSLLFFVMILISNRQIYFRRSSSYVGKIILRESFASPTTSLITCRESCASNSMWTKIY
jgi:hypothetical protein